MSDFALRQFILNELEFEPGVDTAHIGSGGLCDTAGTAGQIRKSTLPNAARAATWKNCPCSSPKPPSPHQPRRAP
jgi:hypothetical protein